MNRICKIFLMNKISIIWLIFNLINANSFDDWLIRNKELLNNKNKLITFDLIENDEIIKGKIAIGEGNAFRFEAGPRIVVSDGKSWKSHNLKTDQIFIQYPDLKFENFLFSWSIFKKLKSLKVKKQNDESYKVKFAGNKQKFYIYINQDSNELDSVLVFGDAKYSFINISIAKLDSMNLQIGSDSSDIFDLR